ncbi:DUF4274 domain-containing protein [Pedobacter metabolipauper]|uniref:Uncharacterized protein DUF4274 n=1 Tax=Pedobacter metabolipauper TaxID=425513 RepID=A0A4R6SYB1_9SPHI|nr:DUF4274 domain-containing protein [Pedobacter metabolipauper]TDQ09485.1 uncharacterized protein DUF4274 [Pedobacter metabolipauper]
MAMQWNGSHQFLEWLVERPKTDLATAVMVYWMQGPRWWKQYHNKQELIEKGDSAMGFDFTETLESKILSGFFKDQEFAFDPTKDDHGTIWANEYLDKLTVREIPPFLFRTLVGEEIEMPAGFEEGMPPDLVKKVQDVYDSYDIIDD